ADFIAGMLKGIVGIALPIARLEGKAKLSQNRPAVDQARAIAACARTGGPIWPTPWRGLRNPLTRGHKQRLYTGRINAVS
ncbi:MAG: hypothetical protein AB7O80_09620, partial [Acetobacteraceae bacterium]